MPGTIELSKVIEDFRQSTGVTNAGGTLEFFENLTLTYKPVFNGYGSVTQLSNPLQLDAGGFEPGVWLGSGTYRIRCRGPAPNYPSVLGPVIWTKDNINVTPATVAQTGNFIINGSFEDGDDGAGVPNGWALTTYSGSTFILDSADSTHGKWSAKCTSIGSGGATLVTTSYTICSVSDAVVWKLRLKSSVADVRNVVSLQWYDGALALLSSTTIYDDATTNPTSWTVKAGIAIPPASAKFYKVTLTGCSPTDPTTGSTWFDGVEFGTTPRQETANVFTVNQTISYTSPQLVFIETDATADNGRWAILVEGENLYLRANNDANTLATNIVVVQRTGTAVDLVTIGGTTVDVTNALTVGGALTVSGALTVGGSLSSTKAAASGYSRVTPNMCRKDNVTGFITLTDSVTTLVTGPAGTKGLILLLANYARSNNGVAGRRNETAVYSNSGATIALAFSVALAYEQVAIAAGNDLSQNITEVHVKADGSGQVWLRSIRDAGALSAGSYTIVGYYD